MVGEYKMVDPEGRSFKVSIPAFSLNSPRRKAGPELAGKSQGAGNLTTTRRAEIDALIMHVGIYRNWIILSHHHPTRQ